MEEAGAFSGLASQLMIPRCTRRWERQFIARLSLMLSPKFNVLLVRAFRADGNQIKVSTGVLVCLPTITSALVGGVLSSQRQNIPSAVSADAVPSAPTPQSK